MIDFADKFDSEERKKENDKIYAKKKKDAQEVELLSWLLFRF